MALMTLGIITCLFKNSSENAGKKTNEINYLGILTLNIKRRLRVRNSRSWIVFNLVLTNTNCIPLSYFQYDNNKKMFNCIQSMSSNI